jgi:hypothetical protein
VAIQRQFFSKFRALSMLTVLISMIFWIPLGWLPGLVNIQKTSKKRWKTMGKLLFMGKLTISMAIFNSYVKLPEGILSEIIGDHNPSQPIGGNPGPVSFFFRTAQGFEHGSCV